MKTISILILFLAAGLHARAQLNIVPKNDELKEYTVQNAQPYDSLTNVDERSFAALPGQTLYMHGARNDSQGYYDTFFTGNFLAGSERQIYKDDGRGNTPAEAVVGKYYEVLKVWTRRDYLTAGCCLLLREKESGDEVYFNPYLQPRSMTCLGYYEKLKRYIGQVFFSLAKRVETEDGQIITPPEGAEYRCVDVGLKMNSDGAFLLMEGKDGVRVEAFSIGGDEVYEFVSAARIASLTERYGEKYGRQVAFRKVDTGMTREMVIAAWGEPYHKSENKMEGKTLESWFFSDDRYVGLLDGKVYDVRIY
ncbi:hypothetical protein QVO10_11810 [Bacteroides gallinaceum]|uniref:WG repeat-containing protein n=1 Tax=Bacteroides gallinaceum TaxID=1462571 RepID=A0ABT7X7K8_9BACE|nr:hypothetical protein [Bacteroides gallinaceum]MBV8040562.1 hypothetical protein [Caecibacteroides pullorum]MDC6281704.1 hypothetical protein [Caecibacteroides pullorum]MDN0050063.1 hypothetical protein [Bacteroides gallinaceum]